MKRQPSSTPGGLNQSSLKRSRLQQLESTSHKGQQAASNKARHATPRPSQEPGLDAQMGAPPYNELEACVSEGPLYRTWQANQAMVLKGAAQAQGQPKKTTSSLPGAPPGVQPGSALDRLTNLLLSTNPAFAARPVEARLSAGLRVRDKSLLLDNPPAATKTAGAQQALSTALFTDKLRPRRRAAHSKVLLQPGDIKYSQLLGLHQSWQQQVTDLVQCVKAQPAANLAASALAATAVDGPVLQSLLQAHLCGCLLTVVACPQPRLVGVQGIVAQVTQHTVVVVDQSDRLHVVPKSGCHVSCTLPDNRTATLVLDKLLYLSNRPAKQKTGRRKRIATL